MDISSEHQLELTEAALSEQAGSCLLTLEQLAQSYFLLGHLEQALQAFEVGKQMLAFPEVTQRDRARFLWQYGKMLTSN